jgi:hypothetical protein
MSWVRIATRIFCTVALAGLPVAAQQNPVSPGQPDNGVQQLQEALRQRDLIIEKLEKRVEALEQRARTAPAEAPTTPPTPNLPSFTTKLAPTPAAPKTSTTLYDEEERVARATLDSTLISRGSLLLPKWTMEVQNSLTYYNASSNNISINGYAILPVLVVGDILSARIQREIVLGAATARLGIPKGFQVEARVPYGYESQRSVNADNTETSNHSYGLGDVEVDLYKQVAYQKKGRPDVLLGMRWKSTTGKDPFTVGSNIPTLGNGFHALMPSVTLAKAIDPAVFFGGFAYTKSLADTKNIQSIGPNGTTTTIGYVQPGDNYTVNVGAVMALNSQVSVSAGYQQGFTRSSRLGGAIIPGSFLNTAVLQLGGSYMYAKGRTLDLTLGVGLTRDSPDFQFTVAMPIRFSLKRTPNLASSIKPPREKADGGEGSQSEVKQ